MMDLVLRCADCGQKGWRLILNGAPDDHGLMACLNCGSTKQTTVKEEDQ